MARTSSKKTSWARVAEKYKSSESENRQASREKLRAEMESGKLVSDMIVWLRENGVNEDNQPLRWSPCFQECLELVADLRIGEVYTTGAAQLMKANRSDDKIYTNKGLKTVKDIQVGDYLIDCEGKPTRVNGVYPQGVIPFYRVTFKDGTSIEVSNNHLWEWYNPGSASRARKQGREPLAWVNTTEELLQDAIASGGFRQTKSNGKPGRYKYAIPTLTGPAQFDCEEPLHPSINAYTMGLLVGDGYYGNQVTLTGEEEDLEFYLTQLEDSFNYKLFPKDNRTSRLAFNKKTISAKDCLSEIGIYGQTKKDKRIPNAYLFGSVDTRIALLQGLMDSDGTPLDSGALFCTANPTLKSQVEELARGLGCWVVTDYLENDFGDFWHVRVYTSNFNPFRLKRKAIKYRNKDVGKQIKAIENIEPVGRLDGTCFAVENERRLYLCQGGIVTHNTLVNALVNAYFGQVIGLRCGWAFPEANMIDVNVPAQHTKILANNAKKTGAKHSRESKTSNRYYDMGIGSNRFHALIAGKGSAAQGTGIISYTADVCFAEEASQVDQAMIKPLISRVEHSISHQMPLRYLGTKGSGAGIEMTIKEKAERVFWPHMVCPSCEKEVVLDPRGTLLKETPWKNKKGEIEMRYLNQLGTPLDWHKTEDGDPYFACPHCSALLEREDRVHKSYYKCVLTGVTVPEFQKILEEDWRYKRHRIAIECGCLLRDKPTLTISQTIIEEGQSPAGARDWCQQQLGIVSDFGVSSVTESQWLTACDAQPPEDDKLQTLSIYGADQGRSQWWNTYLKVHYDPLLASNGEIADYAVYEIIDMKALTSDESCEHADRLDVDCGMIDNEPSIREAARLCEEYDFRLGDQIWNQKDDYKVGKAMDAGYEHQCYKIRDGKFGFMILQAFLEDRVILPDHWKGYLSDRSMYSPAKHIMSVSWNPEEGKIDKAADDIDHWFFSWIFAMAAFVIYLDEPSMMERGIDLDWV